MSYARKITKTQINIGDGEVWITVFWKGKPDQDECHNRAFYAFDDEPEKMRRLLKRGRQMQDIIIARSWQQSKKTVIAAGYYLGEVDTLTYDETLYYFLQQTGRR